LLWGEGIGNIIVGGEPDDLDLFGGMEFGDEATLFYLLDYILTDWMLTL
jgi:hypothetical protein